jgi:hypothetical protein
MEKDDMVRVAKKCLTVELTAYIAKLEGVESL